MLKKLFILPFICAFIISCSTTVEINPENVSGVWTAQEFESTVPGIPEDVIAAGKKEFLSSVYTLNSDNTMDMHSDYFSKGAPGNWELDNATKELSMYYTADTIQGIEKFIITELTKNKMVLRQDIENMDAFVQLTLQK